MNLRKILKNPWTISIGSTLLGFFLTVAYDLFKGKHILSTLISVLSFLWKLLMSILMFDLKVWWVLVGIVIIILALYLIAIVSENNSKKSVSVPLMDYTKDYVLGMSWKWRWTKDYSGTYELVDLRPVCPKCDTPLVQDDYFNFKCLRCKSKFQKSWDDISHVEMMIYDNARRKYIDNQ